MSEKKKGECWLHGVTPHYQARQGKYGPYSQCCLCLSIRNEIWRIKNPNKAKEWREAKTRANPENFFASNLLRNAFARSRKEKLPFNLDLTFVEDLVQREIERGTVVPLMRHPQTPSIDQRVPGAGYTKENVQIVPVWYNYGKRNFPENSFRQAVLEWAENQKLPSHQDT